MEDNQYKYNKDVNLSTIFKKLIINTQINTNPESLNKNLFDNIKKNLKNQELNKCNKHGLITCDQSSAKDKRAK